jgi:peptidoglycan L-alanyl-D-glutamate endopeptidase CwlK
MGRLQGERRIRLLRSRENHHETGATMIGQVETLHPVFKLAVDRILNGMRAKGWDPVIGSGMRTRQQQDALYAQGRKNLGEVNALRKQAGLPPISLQANTATVTDARGGESNHNLTQKLLQHDRSVHVIHGFAVDIVDRRFGWEVPDKKFWKDLGALAKVSGCLWGGDWAKPDPAHVEMKIVDSQTSSMTV